MCRRYSRSCGRPFALPSLSCVLSVQVLVYESRGIYHEQGISVKLHVLSKRIVTRRSQRRHVVAVSKTYIVIIWYRVHQDRRRSREDRVETPDIFLISTRAGDRGKEEKNIKRTVLGNMYSESVIQ